MFEKEKWCVCGSSIRTNNAAESSHAVLNSSVRVSGAVSLEMFLVAIERQMLNTRNEIQRGCPSHTKKIYARRNRLLATELSDLLNKRQGLFSFLDHCAVIMTIKNQKAVDSFLENKRNEVADPIDNEWIRRNYTKLTYAALSLFRSLHPEDTLADFEVLASVESWSFNNFTLKSGRN